jgi:hypothetical protein
VLRGRPALHFAAFGRAHARTVHHLPNALAHAGADARAHSGADTAADALAHPVSFYRAHHASRSVSDFSHLFNVYL